VPAATFARANLEPTTPPRERKVAADRDSDSANFTLVEPATRVAGFSKAARNTMAGLIGGGAAAGGRGGTANTHDDNDEVGRHLNPKP
jgi:hypothetical protein